MCCFSSGPSKQKLCGLDCAGRVGVPPSLHCEVCMCMFHPECVGYVAAPYMGGFVCKVSVCRTK